MINDYRDKLASIANQIPKKKQLLYLSFIGAVEMKMWPEATNLFHSFWNAGLRGSIYQDIKNILDPELKSIEIELTSHGFTRSFRFWSVEEKRNYILDVLGAIKFMQDTISPDVSVCFGAALAIARSDDLIPHDDDIDVLVCLPKSDFANYGSASLHLMNLFKNSEYNVNQSEPHLIHATRRGSIQKFDIFVGLEEHNETISIFPSPRNTISKKDLFPASEKEIFGINLPLPRLIESYLAKTYGQDWRLPDPMFSHNWDITAHADLFAETADADQVTQCDKGDQAKRLKDLEKENERLRKAVSDLTLEKQILKEAASGNF